MMSKSIETKLRRVIREEVKRVLTESMTLRLTEIESKFKVVNESLRSGPNDAYTYPIKKSENPEDLLSGRSRGSWIAKSTMAELLDVFGEEMTIYKGDEVIEYLQVNSKDSDAYVYKIVRRDLRGSRVAGYIPSFYRDLNQTEDVNKTWT